MFPVTSRYHDIETARHTAPDGRQVVYVRRRFLPTGPPPAILAVHEVTQGERLDNITALHLGDPELFWQVCDANGAERPANLTADDSVGRRLLIPVPGGA